MLSKYKIVKKKNIYENGIEKTFLSNLLPIKNELGKIIGKASITLDLTAQECAAEGQVKILDEKLESIRLTAAGIAHEIKTPLATIQALATTLEEIMPILLKAYELANEKELLEDSLNITQNDMALDIPFMLSRAINSASAFLDIAMMELSGKDIDLNEFTMLSMVASISIAKDSYPYLEDEEDLVHFDEARDFKFKGDMRLFRPVFNNLLRNALYYLKASNKKGTKIDIWLEPGDKFNILHFRDTGLGIPKEDLPHIFDMFYSKRPGGHGIGLSLCKDLVEKMEGKIKCHSEEGKYTHFKIYFPKVEEGQ